MPQQTTHQKTHMISWKHQIYCTMLMLLKVDKFVGKLSYIGTNLVASLMQSLTKSNPSGREQHMR
jgi:hypothetical protein